ncbi:DgyrCDS12227 [Dimorphilus gyrociliatus]|uniref:Jumonji domain-containing protein 4 n=1 Tax=Dimorphilus gyrociliatus TaxID=2664684 RepID=A0A7I8W5T2_9ANNE|nr:DgyrCDS12227 [Dimorphilus gyrociliatus]
MELRTLLELEEHRKQHYRNINEISIISSPCSFEYFFINHLKPNIPCIFDTWLTANWKAVKEWVKDDQINDDFMIKKFGDMNVPVANCSKIKYDSQEKIAMNFKSYFNYIKDTESNSIDDILYLKDWHFQKESNYDAYDLPIFFETDWMNEFWDKRDDEKDDYRFLYFGPKGSWTPFHSDVLRSYSWSANICGKKKWIIFPPGEELKLMNGSRLPVDLRDSEKFEELKKNNSIKFFEVYQNSGQTIFVPSGWFHQVFNEVTTLSLNHNWTNACGIDLLWKHLLYNLKLVEKEIDDCKDMDNWTDTCQAILKAETGMDFNIFEQFINTIYERRKRYLHQSFDESKKTGEAKIYHHADLNKTDFIKLELKAIMIVLKEYELFNKKSVIDINEFKKLNIDIE